MIFPYLVGWSSAPVTNDGGWDALDAAYGRPPQSTEQVLHPGKYRDEPDAPMAVDLGELEAGEGWAEAGRNVVGEMQLGVISATTAAGRWLPAGTATSSPSSAAPEGKLGLVWLTTWDTEGTTPATSPPAIHPVPDDQAGPGGS